MKKKEYLSPKCKVVNIEFIQMLASSITGSASDSDDSEFGAPAKASRRGEWGDLRGFSLLFFAQVWLLVIKLCRAVSFYRCF